MLKQGSERSAPPYNKGSTRPKHAFLVSGIAALCSVTATYGSETTPSTLQVSLLPGWNLKSIPSVLQLPSTQELHAAGVQLWLNSIGVNPGHAWVPADPARETNILSGQGMWFWADAATTLQLEHMPQGTAGHSPPKPGWHFHHAEHPLFYKELRIQQLLHWNVAQQSYIPIHPAGVLQPHEGYLVQFAELSEPSSTPWAFTSTARDISTNLGQATTARARLFRFQSPRVGDQEWGYQVEYEAPPVAEASHRRDRDSDNDEFRADDLKDAQYLADFGRVWAYTQGIALAQYARTSGPENARAARALARFLCATAKSSPHSDAHRGWPFSWNTDGDDWQDARLVTGASAWAIHGLGQFITSPAFETVRSPEEQAQLRRCYQNALWGLQAHQRPLTWTDGREILLMTAGWTASGLAHAADPWKLKTDAGERVAKNPNERFAYYSVLDAIGYKSYSTPPTIKVCLQGPHIDCATQALSSSTWQERTISEPEWNALRQRIKTNHVVTEHNLDVLSVLNHAIDHNQALGLTDLETLESWRNRLRDGIFYALWDDRGWKDEFHIAIQALEKSSRSGPDTQVQIAHETTRKQALQEALTHGNLGRIVTGGEILEDNFGTPYLKKSRHSAIDNCSWLSLSVDYQDLKRSLGQIGDDNIYVERLSQCLQYTVLSYTRPLGFGKHACQPTLVSCAEQTRYWGAHYFQNSFRDPYIAPSELQDESYHLEATMGLIMGLHAFATHSEHASSELFQAEAERLWVSAQDFVQDHGFSYSSQRIQNLSTRLSSSTAIIWFIDAHHALHEAPPSRVDSPLSNAGGKLILVRGKAVNRVSQAAIKWIDDLLHLPPELVVTAFASSNALAYLSTLGTEVDSGLETMFIGNEKPSPWLWRYEGVIDPKEAVAQPLETYLRNEEDLRKTVSIYASTHLENPLDGPSMSFDDEHIYYIRSDWIGFESKFTSQVGVLSPTDGSLWEVYRLAATRPRSEVLDAFVQRHPLWVKVETITETLPDAFREPWLYLVGLAIRTDFDRASAEIHGGVLSAASFGPEGDNKTSTKGPKLSKKRPAGAHVGPEPHKIEPGVTSWARPEWKKWLRHVFSHRPLLRQGLAEFAQTLLDLHDAIRAKNPAAFDALKTHLEIYKQNLKAHRDAHQYLAAFMDDTEIQDTTSSIARINALSREETLSELRTYVNLLVSKMDLAMYKVPKDIYHEPAIPPGFEAETQALLKSLDASVDALTKRPNLSFPRPKIPKVTDKSKSPGGPRIVRARVTPSEAYRKTADNESFREIMPEFMLVDDGGEIDEKALQGIDHIIYVQEKIEAAEFRGYARNTPHLRKAGLWEVEPGKEEISFAFVVTPMETEGWSLVEFRLD